MARQKYKVGQEVSVHSGTSPHCNSNLTTITKAKQIKGTSGYRGWGYQTANQPTGSHKWFREESIGAPYAVPAAQVVQVAQAAPAPVVQIMGITRTTFM